MPKSAETLRQIRRGKQKLLPSSYATIFVTMGPGQSQSAMSDSHGFYLLLFLIYAFEVSARR